jgi:hypothetical protein
MLRLGCIIAEKSDFFYFTSAEALWNTLEISNIFAGRLDL